MCFTFFFVCKVLLDYYGHKDFITSIIYGWMNDSCITVSTEILEGVVRDCLYKVATTYTIWLIKLFFFIIKQGDF